MATPKPSTIGFRLPNDVKDSLQAIANHYDLSLSTVILNFCRKGIETFDRVTIKPSTVYTIKEN